MIIRAFELDGATIRWPYRVREADEEIEQIDGVVYCSGINCLLECKDLRENVSIEPIAKLRNQLLRRPAGTVGVIFSRSGFTYAATVLARFVAPQSILLWSGEEIEYALQERNMCDNLLRKYRYCVEQGLAVYNIKPQRNL